MILYHGTSWDAFIAIKTAQSIQPRGSKESLWEMPSNPDFVYLTNSYAFHYALNASNQEKKQRPVVILEVDVNPALLFPDEDFLEQASRRYNGISHGKGMVSRTTYYRDKLLDYQHLAEASLKHLGNATHNGKIPFRQITRFAVIQPKASGGLLMWFDPTITLMNYLILGAFYRDGTRWIFGDEPVEEEGGEQVDRLYKHATRTGIKVNSSLLSK